MVLPPSPPRCRPRPLRRLLQAQRQRTRGVESCEDRVAVRGEDEPKTNGDNVKESWAKMPDDKKSAWISEDVYVRACAASGKIL